MKGNIIILVLIFFIQNIGYSQTIIFSKDSLNIEGEGFYEDIKDSLFIKNSGIYELIIDSIYSNKIYLYPVEVCTEDTSYLFHIIFDQQLSPLTLSPQDSIKLIFYMPDLCPICDGSSLPYFEDILYFRSNAVNNPTYLIYVSGQGTTDVEDNYILPNENSLYQNYPNPFNPTTTIRYSISKPTHVVVKIYDGLGKEITTLVDGLIRSGIHQIEFDGSSLSSGIYFYQMITDGFWETKKLMLLK